MTQHPEAEEQRSVALVKLMANPAAMFYAAVCLSLQHIWSTANTTAWTNGKQIGYCPKFFLSCTPAQQIGLILHETLHVAFMHMFRGHGFDPMLFNMACDYVINLIIIDAGFELPPGALIDEKFRGWSAEKVAQYLLDEAEEVPENMMQDIIPSEKGDSEQIEADLNDILVQASLKVQEIDPEMKSIPPAIRRHISLLRNPPLPWYRYLAKYFTAYKKTGSNWSRPNKRYAHVVYLPIKKSTVMGDLSIYCDASGSLTDAEFNTVLSEAWGIMKTLKPKSIKLTPFNHRLGETQTLKNKNSFESLDIKGKGGTEIGPVFHHIQENKPMVSLIFTDGLFDIPEELPTSQIIWVIIDNEGWIPPCGAVIHMKVA